MKGRDRVIDLLADIKPRVQERVSSSVMAVLSLCEAFRYCGSEFSLDVSEEVKAAVMKVMQHLSDENLEDAILAAKRALKEADLAGYPTEWMDEASEEYKEILGAFDMHASNLLRLTSAWLTIGFGSGMSQNEIYTKIITQMEYPEGDRMWRDAIRARVIDPNEVKFGRGYQRRIPDAITVLIQSSVWQAYVDAATEDAIAEGALYYVVHRGSTFDCIVCDEKCERLTPMDEPYHIPHPRCMCYLEFLFTEEDADKYR